MNHLLNTKKMAYIEYFRALILLICSHVSTVIAQVCDERALGESYAHICWCYLLIFFIWYFFFLSFRFSLIHNQWESLIELWFDFVSCSLFYHFFYHFANNFVFAIFISCIQNSFYLLIDQSNVCLHDHLF